MTTPATAPSIVVADDDPVSRELIGRYLAKMNLRNPVVAAGDGDEVVRLLSDGATDPALLLLDLDMPGRSGLEVLAWVRAQGRCSDLPVVMLTGSGQLSDVDEAYRLDIASYLVKPVGFAALADVLRQLHLPWQFCRASSS